MKGKTFFIYLVLGILVLLGAELVSTQVKKQVTKQKAQKAGAEPVAA